MFECSLTGESAASQNSSISSIIIAGKWSLGGALPIPTATIYYAAVERHSSAPFNEMAFNVAFASQNVKLELELIYRPV
jgi:hypothetical protein